MTGLEFKEFREKMNLTQEQMGEKLGITRITVNRWEKQDTIPMSGVAMLHLLYQNDTLNPLEEEAEEYKPEGKVIDNEDFPEKEVYVIPIKGKGGLENAYFDDLEIRKLKTERLKIKVPSSNGSKWFKIEVEGASMDDSTEDFEGSKYSLCEGDWVYVRSIPKINWKSKLHYHRWPIFCFFHNTRGIIFKKILKHNLETGDLVLGSINKDKERYPDIKTNVAECSYICNVIKVLSDF